MALQEVNCVDLFGELEQKTDPASVVRFKQLAELLALDQRRTIDHAAALDTLMQPVFRDSALLSGRSPVGIFQRIGGFNYDHGEKVGLAAIGIESVHVVRRKEVDEAKMQRPDDVQISIVNRNLYYSGYDRGYHQDHHFAAFSFNQMIHHILGCGRVEESSYFARAFSPAVAQMPAGEQRIFQQKCGQLLVLS